jgi:hypothetical protein
MSVILLSEKVIVELGMVTHTCNSSTREAEGRKIKVILGSRTRWKEGRMRGGRGEREGKKERSIIENISHRQGGKTVCPGFSSY